MNEVPSDWKKYSTNKVSISFPKNWKLNEQPQEGVQFNILAPIDGKNDDFRENINYITQNLTGKSMDLTAFVDLSLNQIKPIIAKGTTLESELKNEIKYNNPDGLMALKYITTMHLRYSLNILIWNNEDF